MFTRNRTMSAIKMIFGHDTYKQKIKNIYKLKIKNKYDIKIM